METLTALGRLLLDGGLRDAFKADPSKTLGQMGLPESESAALLAIPPDDLEYQAKILIRKRFKLIQPLLRETLSRDEAATQSLFFKYGRIHQPTGDPPAIRDAVGFCRHCKIGDPLELNRLKFQLSTARLRPRLVFGARRGGRRFYGLQLLYRNGKKEVKEMLISLGL